MINEREDITSDATEIEYKKMTEQLHTIKLDSL